MEQADICSSYYVVNYYAFCCLGLIQGQLNYKILVFALFCALCDYSHSWKVSLRE